ncbi:hypothetical protein [Massilia sp. DJPM01]|uniref:hypothetical protein n=1 Tax=Massilia sp. DJPM01 TaxID=3024404 RepID=UPI0035A371CE
MVEIGVLKQQCLARRIADKETLVREIAVREKCRNDAAAQIQWMFTIEKARTQLGRVYQPLEQARQEVAIKEAA